jgi:hypothetical protein
VLSKVFVGVFNPLAIQMLKFTNPFVWYGDLEGGKPTDTRKNYDECPFPDGTETESESGFLIALISIIAVCLFTLASSYIIYKKYWNVSIPALNSHHRVS